MDSAFSAFNIPTSQIIQNRDITEDSDYQGLRIVRYQSNQTDALNYKNKAYEFQQDLGSQRFIRATLTRKGMVGGFGKERIVAYAHLTLKQFVDVVKYDPSNPPLDDYNSLEMMQAHDQTQSDFKGQKMKNKDNFKTYLLEGAKGYRPLYLPPIAGWQSYKVFTETIFVALDESDPNALYGYLYLPASPIMQSDGQTQTAALFGLASTKEATESNFLKSLLVTLEIELNVNSTKAGQSFADRNGRGTKKDKNLVIALDQSSALSELRNRAVGGTVFQTRIADGRDGGVSKNNTQWIVDLSTMEQMLLAVVFGNYRERPERLKHYHIEAFTPYAREFFQLLHKLFAGQWVEKPAADSDPFRQVYVHGWAFAQKALAEAYYEARRDQLKPLTDAINFKDGTLTEEEAFKSAIASIVEESRPSPVIPFTQFKERLQGIDWRRHRKHWVKITGSSMKKGKKATIKLKSEPDGPVVVAMAQNNPAYVKTVKDKILSESWRDLTKSVNEPL
ncbi:DNA sulfur modification protein DndB [Hymenobacter sp. BT559]|uniref:DNA sulfur modification protein DndB n=1 Tax=Hymenobacter sp. BT559 TaxID=2795729 RepID=UPI0018ED7EA1|nr:DNA sulfur modification protein DndB [Hymenobacter sp. BT559]MBJ6146300.1 hypothetical protein [Hymenobacter sp. BT559]